MAKRVYVGGGYHSSSIILKTKTGTTIEQVAFDSTRLRPNTHYDIIATIRNDSGASVPVTVTFYNFPGGFGHPSNSTANMIGTPQNVMVSANSNTLVPLPDGDFLTGPLGTHSCAAIWVKTNLGGEDCPNSGSLPPDPTLDVSSSCSAWRNTVATSTVGPTFDVSLTASAMGNETATHIDISSVLAPVEWEQKKEVSETIHIIQQTGGDRSAAIFLPSLQKTLDPVDLGVKATVRQAGARLVQGKKGEWDLFGEPKSEVKIEFQGTIPKDARLGDRYIVRARATYPDVNRTVEFVLVVKCGRETKEMEAR